MLTVSHKKNLIFAPSGTFLIPFKRKRYDSSNKDVLRFRLVKVLSYLVILYKILIFFVIERLELGLQ